MKKLINTCAALMTVLMVKAAFAGTDATDSKYKKDDAKNAGTFFVEENECIPNGGFKFENDKFTFLGAGIENEGIVEGSYRFENSESVIDEMEYTVAFSVKNKEKIRKVEIYFFKTSNEVFLNSTTGKWDDRGEIITAVCNMESTHPKKP